MRKPLQFGIVHRSSWGDEGYLRSGGNDDDDGGGGGDGGGDGDGDDDDDDDDDRTVSA